MRKMIEAEVKVPVKNFEPIRERLKALKAVLERVDEEFDTYFDHPSRSFARTDEALRVRRTRTGEGSITYKGPKFRSKTKTRAEVSIPVDDSESLIKVLEQLGFKQVATVIKRREKWRMEGVNVYLDEVEGLGKFLELEARVENESRLSEVEEKLFLIIDGLGFDRNSSVRESYLELILKKAR